MQEMQETDMGLIHGSGRSLGVGMATYSSTCDRKILWTKKPGDTVHWVAKSWKWLHDWAHACCGLYASLDFLQYCTVSVIFIFIFNVLFCIGAIVFSHVLYSWSLLVIHFKYMLVTFEFYKLVTAYQTTDVKSQCIAKDPNAGKDWRQGWRGWQRMK